MYPGIYKFERTPSLQGGSRQDADRRLRGAGGRPERRSSSSGSWTSWPPSCDDPIELPSPATGSSTRSSVRDGRRAHVRLRQLEAATAKASTCSVTTSFGASRRSAGGAMSYSSASVRPPTPEMCGLAPSRWLASGYVAGGWESPPYGMLATGRLEVVTAHRRTAGPRDTFARSRRTPWGAYDDVDVIHGERSPRRWAWTRTVHGRWRSVGRRAAAATKVSRRRGARLASDESTRRPEFQAGTSGEGSPGAEKSIQEVAFGAFSATSAARRMQPVLTADTSSTAGVLVPHGTTCAPSRSTPRPGW